MQFAVQCSLQIYFLNSCSYTRGAPIIISIIQYRLRNWDREVKQLIQVYEVIKQRIQDFNILVVFVFY